MNESGLGTLQEAAERTPEDAEMARDFLVEVDPATTRQVVDGLRTAVRRTRAQINEMKNEVRTADMPVMSRLSDDALDAIQNKALLFDSYNTIRGQVKGMKRVIRNLRVQLDGIRRAASIQVASREERLDVVTKAKARRALLKNTLK